MASVRKWLGRLGLVGVGLSLLGMIGALATTSGGRTLGGSAEEARLAALALQSRYVDGKFDNVVPKENFTPSFEVMMEFLRDDPRREPTVPIPVSDPQPGWAQPPPGGLRITWLGHSTMLVEIDGYRVLTDPVWGERASPSSMVGPKRFHRPPTPIKELPPLDAVVISHDHYDHLDMGSIEALARRGVPFFVPLGIRDHLQRWGVPPEQIHELDWWGSVTLPGKSLTLVSTPCRHFSGRGLFDRNQTLWTSWVIKTLQHRVYFSGDTGLTPQFTEIGKREGPFDAVMLEVGAYHPSWGDIHLGPDGAVEALGMLGGGPLVPIHWGTFNLGLHPWQEPGERLKALAEEKGFRLLTPRLGVPMGIPSSQPVDPWWREVEPAGSGS